MASKLSIGVTIGAVLGATYNRAFNSATSRVAKLGDAMRSLKAQRGLTEAFERDEAAVSKARIALEKAQRDVMSLKKALKSDSGNQKLSKELQKAEKNAAALSEKLNAARISSQRSGQAMRQAGLDAGKSAQELVRLGRAIDDVEREQKQLNAVMSRRNQASARISEMRSQLLGLAGAAFAAGRAIGQALDVERATVRLATVVNADDVGAAVKASRASAIAFARANLTSEGDVLNIEYALNSAGFEASFARSSAGLVAKVAKITDGTGEQVGEVMATVFNNLGNSLKGAADERIKRIGELLTKTQFKFQIRDFAQLGESFKKASPALARFNVELDQGSTLIGALNSAGLQGSEAGTALSASFRQLGKASNEMGFSIAKNTQGGIDFIGTLENLSEQIGGFDNISDDTNAALQKAFGDEGVRGVVLLGKQLDKLRAAQQDVAEGSRGILDKSYQRFLDSAAGKTEIFQNNVRLLGTAFGAALLPALNTALPALTSIFTAIGQLIERFPAIGTGIGVVLGAFALWTVGVLAANAATWLWNSAILGLSFGKAITGVRAMTITVWNYARGAAPAAWASTVRLGTALGGALVKGGMAALRAILFVGRALLLNPIGIAVTAIAGAAFLIWKNWAKIGPALRGFWIGVKNAASTAWSGIKSVAGTVFEASKTAFSFTPLGLVVKNWSAIKGFFDGFWADIKKAFAGGIGGVFDLFLKIGEKFAGIGAQIVEGLLGGITAGWDRLKAVVTSIGDGIATRFKAVLGIKSPSRVFVGLGDMLGRGLQQGMLGTARAVAGAALTLATAATPPFPGSGGPGVGEQIAQAAGAASVAADATNTQQSAPASAQASRIQITIGPIQITQRPGEDAEALAERVAAAIERKAGRIRRSALGDVS